MLWWGVLLLGLLLAGGYASVTLLERQKARNREDLEALAARRGWTLNITNQSLGRPALLKLSSRGGPEWEAQSRGGSDGKSQVTEFVGREPTWSEGYLFLGASPALLDPASDTSTAVSDTWMRTNIIGDGMGADLNGIRPFDGPDDLVVMATSDPRLRVDLGDMAKLWKAWEPVKQDSDHMPVLLLGPEEIRIRLRHGISTAAEMERFVDLALAIARLAKAA